MTAPRAEIEAPETMARRLWHTGAAREDGARAIRAAREQIRAWCIGHAEAAGEAEKDAADRVQEPTDLEDVGFHKGYAKALEDLVAMLGVGK